MAIVMLIACFIIDYSSYFELNALFTLTQITQITVFSNQHRKILRKVNSSL